MWIVRPNGDGADWEIFKQRNKESSFPIFENYWDAWAIKCALDEAVSSQTCDWSQYFEVLEKMGHLRPILPRS